MHKCVLVADDGNVCDVLYPWSNYDNDPRGRQPHAKFDYFRIGGRYEGGLPLKHARKLRKFFGLFPTGEMSRVSVARKSEIDQESFLAEPPAALFFRGQLYECPLFAEGDALARWQAEFRQRFAEIPDDCLLQIVDAHS